MELKERQDTELFIPDRVSINSVISATMSARIRPHTNPAAASTSATIVIHMAYSFLFVLKVFQQSLPRLCFLSSVIDCLSSRTGAT